MDVKKSTLKSFVKNSDQSLFSIHNLPYGVFYHRSNNVPRIGTAIGDYVLDLTRLEKEGVLLVKASETLFNRDSLNYFASQGPEVWSAVRQRIQTLLAVDNFELQNNKVLLAKALLPIEEVTMMLPFKIGGFTDFYASEHHATNVGKLFRGKENALLPNWKYLPVGYNGRASTVFLSGTDVRRPQGQIKLPDQEKPIFSPTKKLDFELEIGFFIGVGNPDASPIKVTEAKSHIFGLVLLNDWSARDVQAFEYQPLGPFLSKSFATSISAWVVPLEALQEFMTPLAPQTPETVDYLKQSQPQQPNIKLKVELQAKGSTERTVLCETSCKELYWSMEQMLAHHTVNGCIMQTGDLLGTGTISGPEKESWGSLLELSFNGTQPLMLKEGSQRTFLQDGDKIIMTGYCETNSYKIGFGTLEGEILPAIND